MAGLSTLGQFIPGTQARARRLFNKSLAKQAKKADALCWVEYPDGDVRLKPATWNKEINAWVTSNGKRFFPRGKGGDPKRINGVPVVQCHASDAGVISTEAAVAAGAIDEGLVAPVDQQGTVVMRDGSRDRDAVQRAVDDRLENGASPTTQVTQPAGAAATDGGQTEIAGYVPIFDGVEFRLGDAVDYDPFPVREEDARQAAEWFELAGRDDRSYLKYVGYGAVGAFVIVLGLLGFIWLLGEVGGGESTGITLSIGIDTAKLFASIITTLTA